MLTLFNLTPLPEMPPYHLLRLDARARLLDPSNIQCPVLPRKAPHTAHVVSVIRKLVPRETVFGRIG